MARKNLKNVQPIKITLEHGVPMASSLQVAKHFGKAHDNVLRDIRELLAKAPKEWASKNFEDIEESVLLPHSGGIRKDPAFMMTRDGFTMLAMGFTGTKAFHWKIKYIEAFNTLEREAFANIRTFEELRQLLTPPKQGHLDSATAQKKFVSLIRGQLVKWAFAENIPVDVAERTLCAFLDIRNLEQISPGNQEKAIEFIDRQCMVFDGNGSPATENQRTMIRHLVESCAVFCYSPGFDVLTYLRDKYAVTGEELENLTERGADKLILSLIDIMTLLLARTHNRSMINRSFEESCERKKFQ